MGRLKKRPLSVADIVSWAQAYREATGRWPTADSGVITEARFESWPGVEHALRRGGRGVPGGTSLAQFLAERCGARNLQNQPPLTVEQILTWADEHFARTGRWPHDKSGRIPVSGGERWQSIDRALRLGLRGLLPGSSLPLTLAEHRNKRVPLHQPPLTEEQILQWADAHFQRTGSWPSERSGPVVDAPSETWRGIANVMKQGNRGLPRGHSLAMLLAERRGARNIWTRPHLSVQQILAWADAFHTRTGTWPNPRSGAIDDVPGETWKAVDMALFAGCRGFPGGSTLARLLAAERGARSKRNLPPLTRKHILAWADAHHRRTGEWPTGRSGAIEESPGDTWELINAHLRHGRRGLRGRSSLPRLLAQYRGVRNPGGLPLLSKKKIVAWADAHFQKTGTWPSRRSGAVLDAPGEKWDAIDQDLRLGLRGLSGGTSLKRLLIAKGRLPRPEPPASK